MENTNKSNKESMNHEQDFVNIFTELEKQAEVLFPQLQNELKVFNDSQITVENYQLYLNNLNQIPSSINSNHVG